MGRLAHALVTAPNATPRKWIVFLHGILGSGSNWRTFARRLVADRPEWGAVLVDLRLHGGSLEGFERPHSVRRAAEDVAALFPEIDGAVRAVVGHSFGGKVALALARQLRGDLDHVFVVDSTPGARPEQRGSESTRAIVEMLSELPESLPDRESFLAFFAERGVTRPTAMWLAMNVRSDPESGQYVFRIDVPAVKEMLDDYFALDLWSVIEEPPGPVQLHFVAGGQSTVLDDADRARAERAPQATLDVVERAGHWVHADAPDALLAIVKERLA